MLPWRRRKRTKRTLTDPTFGEVTLDRTGWEATVNFEPAGTHVQVLGRHPEGPTHIDRQTFRRLSDGYEGLKPGIREALFEAWKPWLSESESDDGSTAPRTALDLERVTELGAVWLSDTGVEMLTYHFAEDGVWDDASMNVGMKDWLPIPLEIDD